MATLLLSTLGTAIGGALGGPAGALIGKALGGLAGAAADQALLSSTATGQNREGPRLTSVDITGSAEGSPITRIVGRSRLAGQMIWATRFREVATTTTDGGGGGKGLGGGGGGSSTTTYKYYANFAVAFCEGAVDRIGRIWADGREIDQESDDVVIRKYRGKAGQGKDTLIEAKEGSNWTPGYRSVAYVVFENMALETYGNRMPLITAEVYRAVGDLEGLVQSVALIPGTTEFGYDPDPVTRLSGRATYTPDNRHTREAASDLMGSLDLLQDVAEECGSVVLVVAWFGTDLRCGSCEIKPKVENYSKTTKKDNLDYAWFVAGLDRASAERVSLLPGNIPAFGGSPNDASVIACIQELKSRGFRVLLYPFVMMDIEKNNALPNPYFDHAAGEGQAAYPWRGRITCSPAPGYAGSPDQTATVATQIASFVGTASASDFAGSSGTAVSYSGPAEWRYRRFILHMATLADLAGGVDAFTIGSEMVGLTTVRSSASNYPFVTELVDLLGEARTILGGGTKLGYAADWSEYHSHRPDDGSDDVYFHLDPLWSDDDLVFVGIDNYLPVADWRDGTDHLDYDNAGPTAIYDLDYLKGNIEAGEYYDWYYASEADRDAQARTPITDGAYGKPWVFRNKDIRNWWTNEHHNRPGGVESGSPTGWTAKGKPIFFTELGCPAVDKGPNQPNVFHDPKSSESFLPHYSSGARDDAAQRAYLQAMLDYWGDEDNDPGSGVYGGRMINRSWISVWSWDARMVPSFPQDETTWADAPNWEYGHWISGRLGSAPARETIQDLLRKYDVPNEDYRVNEMAGVVDAVVIDRVMSIRAVLEAISPAYLVHVHESEGKLRFSSRIGEPVIRDIALNDLVDIGSAENGADRFLKTRGQETELPDAVKVVYGDPVNDDLAGAVEARRSDGGSMRVSQIPLPVVMGEARARALAETLLFDAWVGREILEFALPPSHIDLDPGDVIRFLPGSAETWRIAGIDDGLYRRLRAARVEASLYAPAFLPRRGRAVTSVPALGAPLPVFLDGPLLQDSDDAYAGYVAAFVAPWPGGVAFYKSPSDTGFLLDTVLSSPATMGVTAFDFHSGPVWRWDRVNDLYVDLDAGPLVAELSSAGEINVLAGANALAVENADGEWEILQFQTAELIDTNRYKLSMLLRGQRGSEHAMRDPVSAGARVLVLDGAVSQTGLADADMGLPYTWRVGPVTRDVSDNSYGEHTITMSGKGRRPLAPVRLRGKRDHATGDWTLSWIRRTRAGGDSWNQTEVPLSEESEAYRLEILDAPGGSVLLTISLGEPGYLYTAAQQVADFGSLQWNVPMRVTQLSASYGAGIPAEFLTYDT